MKTVMKKTTIEGLTSPAVANAGMQKANTSPVFKVDIRRSLRMHPTAALLAGAAVFLLVVVFGLTRKPLYMAKSLTYIEPLTKSVLSDGTTATFDPSRYDSYLQQQMLTATRPDIIQAALAQLPVGTWQQPGETTQSAVARLQSALKVERVTTSYQLAISLQGSDPVATAATVNAVTNAYLAQGRHDEHLVTDQRLKLLSEERQRIQAELDQDRSEQTALGQVLGVANPVGDSANPYDMQLANVRSELQSARQAHDVAAAQLASLHNEGGARSPGMVASADDLIAGDPGLSSMKSTINQRKAALSTQMAGLTPSNPVYKQSQDEIADLDKSMDAMTTDLRDKAERRLEDRLGLELRRTGDIEGRLNGQLAQQTATATNAGPRLQRAGELAADLIRLTTRYATVDDAMRGMELEANGPGLAHLSVAATVPTAPEASKMRLLLLSALPLALFAGILTAVLLHKRDPRVYTSRDVEEVLGFLPIGVLPARAEVSDAVVEEYLLRLAAGLESAYRVSDARSYVFSAASPVTDVSAFVEALSRKLRQLGLTALIVEASRLLQPLHEDATAGEVMRPGISHESFATANLERLKSEHDLLLIDAPPLLHSAETEYAVRCADATILVAECGVTLRAELLQSAALLERLNVAGVGAVLEEVKLSVADARFRNAVSVLENRHDARPESRERAAVEAAPAVSVMHQVGAVERVAEIAPRMAEEPLQVKHAEVFEAPVEVVEAPLKVQELPVAPMSEQQHEIVDQPLVAVETAVAAPAEIAAQPLLKTFGPVIEEEEPELKKSWLQRLFVRGGTDEKVSILPDFEEEERGVLPVAMAQSSLASSVPEPAYDIAPLDAVVAQVAEPVEKVEPKLVAAVEVPVVPVDAPVMQTAAEMPVAAEPLAAVPVEVAPVVVEAVYEEAAEPAFIQVFEEPVFTRDAVALEEPVAAVMASVEPVMPMPVAPIPLVAAAPVVNVMREEEKPRVEAMPLLREVPVRRSEVRPAYVPPVMPVQPRFKEPLTTGRWEPVRPARLDATQSASGLHEAAPSQSSAPAAERGVSRISGGRRAAAAMGELRDIEPRPVRSIPSAGWIPPVPAARNVNPLGDDGLQSRPGALTRRWELLSRFDQGANAMRPLEEDADVTLAAQGRAAGSRNGR